MSHLAWDRGVIADAMKQVIGCAPAQKTTKTYCGLRVPTAQIDEQHPTCDRCIARWAEEDAGLQSLIAEAKANV